MNDGERQVGRASPAMYAFVRVVVWLVGPLIARLRTEGMENIPAEGPLILAMNHIHWTDIPLASLRVRRVTHYMAKIELFRVPVLGGIMRLCGAFPVRRGEGDRESLRNAERLLAAGEVIVIFPEGHRSGGHLIPAHPGAALIALRTNAPIVAVGICGTEKVMKGLRYGPFAPRVTVRFGEPFSLGQAEGRRTREGLARGTEEVMRHIAALLPPEYRGAYGDAVSGALDAAHATSSASPAAPAPRDSADDNTSEIASAPTE